ncbi:hypothetical protein ABEB36_014672 [Hypothenemus hampei]|uniref:Uncharacterized protein n=1 Tax=Hypothenemus hampei TaxID=57062 RepID=A0ABD1E2Q7_HYPHA
MKVRRQFGTSEVRASSKLAGRIGIFDFCKSCVDNRENMSVPQGAFAAKKARNNMEKWENQQSKENAFHYNSKYMNSIWGMYNRFSVHNLKQRMDDNQ